LFDDRTSPIYSSGKGKEGKKKGKKRKSLVERDYPGIVVVRMPE